MISLPIFDANAHPTVNGMWFGEKKGVGFSSLTAQMNEHDVRKACAVGMYGIGGYEDEAFIRACNQHSNLVPIAGLNPQVISDFDEAIGNIQKMGFAGVKIHPRICGITLDSPQLRSTLDACASNNLPVFLCTYYWEKGESLIRNNYEALVKLISEFEALRLVLLHGGVHDLLRLSEVARYYPNVLLDLSFTMVKYEGSSLDLDIRYLFHQFDRRICIGSDQPEWNYSALRSRFEYFSRDISEEKARNIAYRNLAGFLEVPDDVFQER